MNHHLIMNEKTGEIALKHLQYHFVELPKFNKIEQELISNVDKWIYFMKEAESLELIPESCKSSKEIVEAFHVIEKALWTAAELEEYIIDMDEIGREKRIEDGAFERGKQKNAEETAINLINLGLPDQIISQGTGLSIEQVQLLAKKIRKIH